MAGRRLGDDHRGGARRTAPAPAREVGTRPAGATAHRPPGSRGGAGGPAARAAGPGRGPRRRVDRRDGGRAGTGPGTGSSAPSSPGRQPCRQPVVSLVVSVVDILVVNPEVHLIADHVNFVVLRRQRLAGRRQLVERLRAVSVDIPILVRRAALRSEALEDGAAARRDVFRRLAHRCILPCHSGLKQGPTRMFHVEPSTQDRAMPLGTRTAAVPRGTAVRTAAAWPGTPSRRGYASPQGRSWTTTCIRGPARTPRGPPCPAPRAPRRATGPRPSGGSLTIRRPPTRRRGPRTPPSRRAARTIGPPPRPPSPGAGPDRAPRRGRR